MKILHSSDLHGNYRNLLIALHKENYDAWVDTGDFFADIAPGFDSSIAFQTSEANTALPVLVEVLDGRPLISVSGNHDYISLADEMRRHGGVAFSVQEGPVSFQDEVFAGFREIPWIAGEWKGEVHDFKPMVDLALVQDPTILLTHAPPGILSGNYKGITALAHVLAYTEHRVKACLFGHVHEDGGKTDIQMGIRFFNGARNIKIIEV